MENNNKDYQYIYFIENHLFSSAVIISLLKTSNEVEDLEKAKQDLVEEDKQFKYTLYRFKIYKSKLVDKLKQNKQLEFTIRIKDENDNEFTNKIIIKDINRDTYIYNFAFQKNKNLEPPQSYNLSLEDQFEIYKDYIRKVLKKIQKTKENDDFIVCSQNLLMGREKKFKFSFYLMILLECFSTDKALRHLTIFKNDRISEVGTISERRVTQIKNILKILESKPDKILNSIKEDKDKEGNKIKFYGIVLYFNFNFVKERIQELLNDANNKIYYYKALLQFNILFKYFKVLNKEQFDYLIQFCKDFKELNYALNYFKGDFFELLQIIEKNLTRIIDYAKLEIQKNEIKPKIDLESLVTPSNEDNLKSISEKYISLFNKLFEELKTKDNILEFNSTLLEKYIIIFKDSNIDNLFILKDLKNFLIIKNDNVDMDKIIHETGLFLSKNGKLKNIDLLKFIKKDIYYNDIKYNKKYFRSLDILNSLDINSFNDEFYSEWKK